jgi:YggT family protein
VAAVLTVLWAILLAYLFLIMLRIVLGWFAPSALGSAWVYLCRATDPYLGLFSRIPFLRGGLFDFSPIAAVLVLVVATPIVNQLREVFHITLGFVLGTLVSAAWSGAQFLLLFFMIIGLLRMIPFTFRSTASSPLWRVVDTLMQPVVAWVMRLLRLGRRSGYTQHLLLTIGLLFVAWVFGLLLIPQIVWLFQMLPI